MARRAWLADTLFFIFGVMAYTIPGLAIVGGAGLRGVISSMDVITLTILLRRYAYRRWR